MEQILNLLSLTSEEQNRFQSAAPTWSHCFAPNGVHGATGEALTEQDYAQATIILGNPPKEMLLHCKKLRWLHTASAGMDHYMEPGLLPPGAQLTGSSGAYGQSVSEHLFAMLLALYKHLPRYRDQQMQGRWNDLGQARTLVGAKVLVVGTGDLGSCFARLCKALGAETMGVRRNASRGAEGIDRMFSIEQLDGLLPQADVVALMLPHTPDTTRLMDEKRLALMKKDGVLLNGGRGSAVDHLALAHCMASGHLLGAGLDVTEPEPLPEDHPLWKLPNVLITPHVAGGEHLAITPRRVASIACEALAARYQKRG